MKTFFIAAVLIFTVFSVIKAQEQNADFTNKLKPEYKLNLSPQPNEASPENRKKTATEIEGELKYLNNQQKNIEQEIAKMDAEGISKEDNMYVKMQLSLKYTKGQIASREKYLQRYQSK
jgi:peptidoglycan hydrolase CwlO-like protein